MTKPTGVVTPGSVVGDVSDVVVAETVVVDRRKRADVVGIKLVSVVTDVPAK
jgi:hypothetical protein